MESQWKAFQGRWHCREETGATDVERFIDVREDIFFFAVQYHRGKGPFKSRHLFLTVRSSENLSGDEIDFEIERFIEDGVNRTPEFTGATIRGLLKIEGDLLLLSLSGPNGDRPSDLLNAQHFPRR